METDELILLNDCLLIAKLSDVVEQRKLFANVISSAKLIQWREDKKMIEDFLHGNQLTN